VGLPYIEYDLVNLGNTELFFGAARNVDWITLSPSIDGGATVLGNLLPGETRTVRATINDLAKLFCVGNFDTFVEFTDFTNGPTISRRDIALTVNPAELDPPEVSQPPDLNVEATGLLTPVELGLATAFDQRDGYSVPVPSSTGPFGIGVTDIAWDAVDCSGNIGRSWQQVTVADTTGPVLTVPPPLVIKSFAANTLVQEADLRGTGPASAVDLVDGAVTPSAGGDHLPTGGQPISVGRHGFPGE
jgi:hypothetical protein